MTALETLGKWVAGLEPAMVPDEQHVLARQRILDTLGLIAAGAATPAGRSVAAWCRAMPAIAERTDGATDLVSGRAGAVASAALAHGTLAHARDFDDTFAASVVHPGSTVIPAALAVAEARGLSLAATTTAITAGYEVAARLGAVAGRGFHARGFHATSIVGPISAAAAVGRLMGLDAEPLADALGLATSMSGGTMAFLGDGGWSKWLHTGWSAHGGITAAGLASTGFRGPRQALEHPQGFYGAFLGQVPAEAPAAITRDLGQVWVGATALFKLYPCAHVIHPLIEAALDARRRLGLRAGDVEAIVCRIPPWAMPIVAEPRAARIAPRNDLEAIASLPYMVAAGLSDGAVGLATLSDACLARTDIRELAARVACIPDAALVEGFDGGMEIAVRSGARHALAAVLPGADPDRVRAKFRANAALGGMARAAAVEAALLDAKTAPRELMALAALGAPMGG